MLMYVIQSLVRSFFTKVFNWLQCEFLVFYLNEIPLFQNPFSLLKNYLTPKRPCVLEFAHLSPLPFLRYPQGKYGNGFLRNKIPPLTRGCFVSSNHYSRSRYLWKKTSAWSNKFSSKKRDSLSLSSLNIFNSRGSIASANI